MRVEDQSITGEDFPLAALDWPESLKELISILDRFEGTLPESWAEHAPHRVRVAVAGNYNTQFVSRALRAMLAARGVTAKVHEVPFDQWDFQLRNPESDLHGFRAEVLLLLITVRGRDEHLTERVQAAVDAAKGSGIRHVAPVWCEPVSGQKSLEAVRQRNGDLPWFAERWWSSAKLPFHPDHTASVSRYLAGVVRVCVSPRIKLIATDLDGVLWGGVVGEAGADGVDLDSASFQILQKFLRNLRGRGLLLVLRRISQRNYHEGCSGRQRASSTRRDGLWDSTQR